MHRSYRLQCPTGLHYNVYLYILITFSWPMQSNSSLFFDKTLLFPCLETHWAVHLVIEKNLA
jgi:hypothetical protein